MPLFIFIAGYFSKNFNSADYSHNVISKLVLPYFLFESLYSLFDYWLLDKEKLVFSYLTPYWIMWFYFSLMLWKAVLPYAVKMRYALPASIVLAAFVGYASDVGYYASLSRTIVFFPFFLAGYYFDKRYLERFFTRTYRLASLGMMAVIFLALHQYGHHLEVQWFYGSYSYEALKHQEWYAGIYRIILYSIAIVLSLCALTLVPQKQMAIISQLGQNTLYTYVLHGFIMKLLIAAGFYGYFTTTWSKALLIVIGVGIAMLLSTNGVRYLLQWLIEPKVEFLFKRSQQRIAFSPDRKSSRINDV